MKVTKEIVIEQLRKERERRKREKESEKTYTKRQNSIKNAQLCIDDKDYVPNRYDKDNVSVNYLLILPELDSIARDSTDLQESRVTLLPVPTSILLANYINQACAKSYEFSNYIITKSLLTFIYYIAI